MPSRTKFLLAAALLLAGLVAAALALLAERPEPAPPAPPPRVERSVDPTPAGPHAAPSAPHDVASATAAPVLDGPGLVGRVRTPRGLPVPGAALVASVVRGDERRELGRAAADSEGRFALTAEFAESAPAASSTARLELDVRASGFQSKRESLVLADLLARAEHGRATIEIVVEPGQDLSGRVVDRTGAPRAGAEVALWVPSLRASAEVERVAASTRTGPDGRFELGYTSEGAYVLRAKLENVGAFERAPLELLATGNRELGDLVLRGDGTIDGVATHPDGAPARDVELWAVPASLASERDAPRRAVATLGGREHADGLLFTRAFTDETGRFHAAGLVPGSYAIVAAAPRTRIEPAAMVVSTPANDVRLLVPGARVGVRIVDEQGRPLVKARVACSRLTESGDGGPAPVSTEWKSPRAASGLAVFDVEPETSYALRAESGARVAEDLVHLAPGEFSVERTLVLLERANGRLRLVLEAFGGGDTPRVRASLASALTGEPLDECSDREVPANGVLDALPPGRYRLRLDPIDDARDPRAFLPLHAPEVIEIESGRTLDRTYALVPGARVEVELALDGPPPADFEFHPSPEAHPDDREAARRIHENAHGALVVLAPRPEGRGEARALVFEAPTESAATSGASSTLLPGRGARAAGVFAPGEYSLRASAPGFAPAETELVLRPGAVAHVKLALRAQ